MLKGFIKNKEDFTCENCGAFIQGNGYTNHCHECFHSKHVDIQPGDRLATCGGLMKPTEVSGSTRNIVITHTCQTCGFTRNNKLQEDDNVDRLAELITVLNSRK
jgi:Zn finger protein HypA/HybF involved in hydrogenase expression